MSAYGGGHGGGEAAAGPGWATLRVGVFADLDGDGARGAGEPYHPAVLLLAGADGDSSPLHLGVVGAPLSLRLGTAGGLHYLVAPALEDAPVEGARPWVPLDLRPGGPATEVLFAFPALPPVRVTLDGGQTLLLGEPGLGGGPVLLAPPAAGEVVGTAAAAARSKYGDPVLYRAPLGFEGEVRLAWGFAAPDGSLVGPASQAVVSVVQTPDAPVARDDGAGFDPATGLVSYVVAAAGTPLSIAAADLLANDTDADGDPLSVVSVGAATGGASVALSADARTVHFLAPAGLAGGEATFAYTVADPSGLTATATVTVRVTEASSAAAADPAPALPPLRADGRATAGADLVLGTARGERLFGLAGDDVLRGLAGRDTLDGGAGDDRLDGGAGDDALLGQVGDDTLDGGAGADRLRGGAGADTFVLRAGDTTAAGSAHLDAVLDFEGAGRAGGDRLRLEGFGPGASLAHAGEVASGSDAGAQLYRVVAAGGAVAAEFALVSHGGARLAAGDYAFF